MKRRGPGRPKSAEGEGLTKIFSIRLSPKELEQVQLAADALGVKPAAWARLVLLEETSAKT